MFCLKFFSDFHVARVDCAFNRCLYDVQTLSDSISCTTDLIASSEPQWCWRTKRNNNEDNLVDLDNGCRSGHPKPHRDCWKSATHQPPHQDPGRLLFNFVVFGILHFCFFYSSANEQECINKFYFANKILYMDECIDGLGIIHGYWWIMNTCE